MSALSRNGSNSKSHANLVQLEKGLLLVSALLITGGLSIPSDTANWPSFWRVSAGWFVAAHKFVAIMLNLVAFGFQTYRQYVGDPKLWVMIKTVLDDLQSDCFKGMAGKSNGTDRVTLFQLSSRFYIPDGQGLNPIWWIRAAFNRFFGPCEWLRAVQRSGEHGRRKDIWFHAPDDSERSRGVAGRAHATGGVIHAPSLPALGNESTPEEIAEYAKKGYVDEEYVRARLKTGVEKPMLARSIYAMPIPGAKTGKFVLVLDSKNPGAFLPDEGRKPDSHCKKHLVALKKLLDLL